VLANYYRQFVKNFIRIAKMRVEVDMLDFSTEGLLSIKYKDKK